MCSVCLSLDTCADDKHYIVGWSTTNSHLYIPKIDREQFQNGMLNVHFKQIRRLCVKCKVKVTRIGKAAAFGSPWGNYFTILCAANIHVWCPWISNLHRHSLLRVPIYTLVERSLGDSFLVSWGQCRIRITDVSINSRTRCQWPRAPNKP